MLVILCMGFDPLRKVREAIAPSPAGRTGQLHSANAEVNKNVVVVLTAVNIDMTRWIEKVPALLHAWYPGQEGGIALAQILFGEYSPSGKLPASFERRWEDNPTFIATTPRVARNELPIRRGFSRLPVLRSLEGEAAVSLWIRLSYTTFEYTDLKISPSQPALALLSPSPSA